MGFLFVLIAFFSISHYNESKVRVAVIYKGGVKMRKIIILITLLTMLLVASVARANESYDITIDSSGPAIIKSSIILLRAGATVNVTLYAPGGAGYEWRTNLDKTKLVKQIAKNVSPAYADKEFVGGKMKYEFTLQVQNIITDREDVRFELVRNWEKDKKPDKEFVLSVMLGNAIETN